MVGLGRQVPVNTSPEWIEVHFHLATFKFIFLFNHSSFDLIYTKVAMAMCTNCLTLYWFRIR